MRPVVQIPETEALANLFIPEALIFLFAGNATFTIVSVATKKRFTYNVKAHKTKANIHFVSLLQGSDNESAYGFLGTIFDRKDWRHSKKSKVGAELPSAKGFPILLNMMLTNSKKFDEQVEFWHEGLCCRCGRKLTVPSSIQSGIGPECQRIMERNQSNAV